MSAMEKSVVLKEAMQSTTVVARSATQWCDSPGRFVGICDRKGRSAETWANVVTVFACEADVRDIDGDSALSKKGEAFVCDVPGQHLDESGDEGGCSPLT